MKNLLTKRNFNRLLISLKYKINPLANETITKIEREAMLVFIALVKHSSSELLMHPTGNRYYIKSASTGIFITLTLSETINSTEISIINHIYGYNVKLGQRATRALIKIFITEVNKRRLQMENDYNSNIQHSLHHIAKTIKERL